MANRWPRLSHVLFGEGKLEGLHLDSLLYQPRPGCPDSLRPALLGLFSRCSSQCWIETCLYSGSDETLIASQASLTIQIQPTPFRFVYPRHPTAYLVLTGEARFNRPCSSERQFSRMACLACLAIISPPPVRTYICPRNRDSTTQVLRNIFPFSSVTHKLASEKHLRAAASVFHFCLANLFQMGKLVRRFSQISASTPPPPHLPHRRLQYSDGEGKMILQLQRCCMGLMLAKQAAGNAPEKEKDPCAMKLASGHGL